MTTTIKVTAHCADNKRVHVQRDIGHEMNELTVLKDGDEQEFIVYDDVQLTVQEIEFAQPEITGNDLETGPTEGEGPQEGGA